MESVISKEYTLKGLCCPMCALKMESGIREIPGVNGANINFSSGKLILEIDEEGKLDEILTQSRAVVKRYEPETEIDENTGPALRENTDEAAGSARKFISRAALLAGAALFAAGIFLSLPHPYELIFFLAVYLLTGGEILLRAAGNIKNGQIFDENFLMSVASIGALVLGQYHEAVAVMLFYRIGEGFEDFAIGKSRKSITALMDIRPDFANLKQGDDIRRVSPEDVAAGNLIVVRPGERVPLDGVVTDGFSALDVSALTGESMPRDAAPGSEVLSGSINKNGLLTIEVSREFRDSTVFKILDMVENAGNRKTPVENFITKFARYYTPAVVFSALALAFIPPLVTGDFFRWFERALVFLVVSCPCALVISVPLTFFGGIGSASKRGILVKGSNYLEALNSVDTVVFDKTGTLTYGVFDVVKVEPFGDFSAEELFSLAARAESHSNHPVAVSIVKAYGKAIEGGAVSDYEEIPGHGVRVTAEGKRVLAGNALFMETNGISFPQDDYAGGSSVRIAVDGAYAGRVIIADKIRPDSALAVSDLKSIGVRRVVMLTGDSRETGEKTALELGLDAVYPELLPHQKVEKMEEFEADKPAGRYHVFVGDGINDAPVLARSDVGIAMGGTGSDAAIEAADIVLMKDEPSGIVTAISIAKKTKKIVWQNIIFALGVKAVILVLGALGIANMWAAVFGDVGVTIIAILNAMRALRHAG